MKIALIIAIVMIASTASAETWTVSPDGTRATVTGRTLVSPALKANPLWWFENDVDPVPPAWYEPGVAQNTRVVDWYLRNPLQNFGRYVAGVADRNYTVVDPGGHATASTYADIGMTGCMTKQIIGAYPFPLPYMSCSTGTVTWYAGWQPNGFFGFKYNVLNSSVQLVKRYQWRHHAHRKRN
jgi:hypothetical protein